MDCLYYNLTEKPSDFGEPVYIRDFEPEPEPQAHPMAKDFEVWAKIGLIVVSIYVIFKYVLKDYEK